MTGSSPEVVVTLPELLRRARIRSLWTQRELADRLGVTDRTIRDWESGAARPALSRVPALERVLELDTLELIQAITAAQLGGTR